MPAFVCQLCGHSEHWSTQDAAGCASSWHVWEEHREVFVAQIGRAIRDPRPETVGRREF